MKKLVMIGLVAGLLGPVAAQAADRDHDWSQQQRIQAQRHDDRRQDRLDDLRRQADRHDERRQDRLNDLHQQAVRHDQRRAEQLDDLHRQAARRWYATHSGWSRPVPRSISAQIARDRYMPRGYYRPAPYQLIQVLPPAPRGYGYFAIGSDVVLAATGSRLIIDVIR